MTLQNDQRSSTLILPLFLLKVHYISYMRFTDFTFKMLLKQRPQNIVTIATFAPAPNLIGTYYAQCTVAFCYINVLAIEECSGLYIASQYGSPCG